MSENGYRGRSQATLDLLEACKKIIEETAPITIRGICYRLFVAGHIDSMAVKNTQKISRLLTRAREEGDVDWNSIVDESRSMEEEATFTDLAEYARGIEQWYRRDFWAHQENRIIVISEKATVAGILRPVLGDYGVPFFPVHGFNSATKMHDLAQGIASDKRHTVLLYVGDYDPSGMYMSEWDLPGRLADYGAGSFADDYTIRRIALTYTDVHDGKLPPFKADDKKQDPRYRWFVDRYGQRCWELDANGPERIAR